MPVITKNRTMGSFIIVFSVSFVNNKVTKIGSSMYGFVEVLEVLLEGEDVVVLLEVEDSVVMVAWWLVSPSGLMALVALWYGSCKVKGHQLGFIVAS